MAVTLLVYAAARIPIHWIRWHFASLDSRTLTIPLDSLLSNVTGSPYDLANAAVPAQASLHGITFTGPSGRSIGTNQGNFSLLQQYCPNLRANPTRDGVLDPAACASRVQDLSLHATVRYQPASHFWITQTIEGVIFIGLAALLVTAAVLAVNRRRPT